MASTRSYAHLLALAVAASAALLLAAVAHAGTSPQPGGSVVALKKTALGTILVDGRGRTLYLFEKDRRGTSTCDGACPTYWPPLTSSATPRAGKGVHQSLLRLARGRGSRQVTYAGHPLYTFVGDKRPGQTSGQGLDDFGAEWYVLGATGQKVERGMSSTGGW